MAVEILWDPSKQVACMWDNTSDTAFGPVFSGPSADTEVQEFLDWAQSGAASREDVRAIPAEELERLARNWCDLPTVNTDA